MLCSLLLKLFKTYHLKKKILIVLSKLFFLEKYPKGSLCCNQVEFQISKCSCLCIVSYVVIEKWMTMSHNFIRIYQAEIWLNPKHILRGQFPHLNFNGFFFFSPTSRQILLMLFGSLPYCTQVILPLLKCLDCIYFEGSKKGLTTTKTVSIGCSIKVRWNYTNETREKCQQVFASAWVLWHACPLEQSCLKSVLSLSDK